MANSSGENCCGSPVIHLPPVDVICDPVSDKSRKARRIAAKDKHADNWKYCVKTCIHNGKDNHQIVQCHLCQSWVHPECFAEDNTDIIGIWSCASCRMLPTFVERILEKTSQLASLVVKLERSNQQLVSLMGEQNQEIRGLREDKQASRRRRTAFEIEVIQKRALKYTFLGFGYAEIFRRVNLDTLNVSRDSTCQKYRFTFIFCFLKKDILNIILDKKMCSRYKLLDRIDSLLLSALYTVCKKAINT